jgi:hypothetical protein
MSEWLLVLSLLTCTGTFKQLVKLAAPELQEGVDEAYKFLEWLRKRHRRFRDDRDRK